MCALPPSFIPVRGMACTMAQESVEEKKILARNRQVSVRSSLAQRVALQTYSQYVEAQGASTA
jgi:hypothetical protein